MKTERTETALVIGGGSGMGRAVSKALGAKGIRTFVADIRFDAAEEAALGIRESGGEAEGFQTDISDPASVRRLFKDLRNRAERLDLMVQTAAVLGKTVPIEDMDDDEWRKMMSVNLDGVFHCCREAIRCMKERGSGRIVLFSSVASLTPTPGAIHYSASKGAVNMFARTLAAETAKYNIRVNVVAPGYVETQMLEGLPDGFSDYVLKKLR